MGKSLGGAMHFFGGVPPLDVVSPKLNVIIIPQLFIIITLASATIETEHSQATLLCTIDRTYPPRRKHPADGNFFNNTLLCTIDRTYPPRQKHPADGNFFVECIIFSLLEDADEHDFECVRRRTDEIVEKLGHAKHSLICDVTECNDVQVRFECYSNLPGL